MTSQLARRSVLAAVLVACAALCGCSHNGTERETSTNEVIDQRFEGEPGTYYEYETVTDTRTGVVYLVWRYGIGRQDAVGGITPLLDRDGSVTLDPKYTGETEGE